MRRLVLRGVAALVVLVGASGCAVRTVDCWQLDGEELAQAEYAGFCNDAFALNSHQFVPLDQMNRKRVRKAAAVKAVDPAETKPAKGKPRKKKPRPSPSPAGGG